MQVGQKTLKKSYSFEGKGLHSGLSVKMTISPAPENTGIRFKREDLGGDVYIEAVVENVTHTQRSTTLERGEVRVQTIEHVLSTLYGMGVDNAIVSLNNYEVPIMDGSAKPFADAISRDGLEEQSALRKVFAVKEKIHFSDPKSGAELTILPADEFSIDLTIDYSSNVLGVQTAHYTDSVDYAREIAPCRTFVFFHELEFLFKNNMIRGGDVENAIVIVEHPVPQDELDRMVKLFNVDRVERLPEGYLNNIVLRYPNECARHKLLDVIGDFSLIGYRIKGKVIAHKVGHKINTQVAALIREAALKEM